MAAACLRLPRNIPLMSEENMFSVEVFIVQSYFNYTLKQIKEDNSFYILNKNICFSLDLSV
jgi:hypothetical protein